MVTTQFASIIGFMDCTARKLVSSLRGISRHIPRYIEENGIWNFIGENTTKSDQAISISIIQHDGFVCDNCRPRTYPSLTDELAIAVKEATSPTHLATSIDG